MATFTITTQVSELEHGRFSISVLATRLDGGQGSVVNAIVSGDEEAAERCDQMVLATAERLRASGHEVVVAED